MGRARIRLNQSRWLHVRRVVLERDGYRCRECGKAARLEVDHRTALADGGQPWDLDNLQALCSPCHFGKTALENRARRPLPPAVAKWRQLLDDFG